MQRDDGCRGVGEGRNLRAGGQSMPQADPSATFLERDVGSRGHRLTIARTETRAWMAIGRVAPERSIR